MQVKFSFNLLVSFLIFPSFEEKHAGNKNVFSTNTSSDVPLILTKFVERNLFGEARRQSFVQFLADELNISSHSGFFNVNSTFNCNMFFWFFPNPKGNAVPLLLWSNGGPATSALEGLFLENGPIYVNENMSLERRSDSWTNEYSVLFVDTPVGAGFSFSDSENGYSTNTEEISGTLFAALGQFFQVFHEFETADLYATAQSYGTKYMVSLGNRILNSNSPIKQHFKGVLLLVPFLSPAMHFDPKYHHQVGLIDGRQLDQLESISQELRDAVTQGRMRDATALLTHTLLGALPASETILTKYTGMVDLSNILGEIEIAEIERFVSYLEKTRVHLHVGTKAAYHLSSGGARNALRDIPVCELAALRTLLDNDARVLIVCGNLDAYVPCSGWDRILDTMRWRHSTIWKHTARRTFGTLDDGDNKQPLGGVSVASVSGVSGYLKCAANLCFAVIRNAGHLIPTDQPKRLLQVMAAFTHGNTSRGTP